VIKTASISAALTAAAVAAGIAVLPASGQSPTGARTLTYVATQGQRDFNAVDQGRKGESPGDRLEFSSMLHQNGKVAGRVEADCAAVDSKYKALVCNLVAILPDGRISLQGAYLNKSLPGVGGRDEQWAVTGGTGAYAGATGTMKRAGNGKHDTLTFTLSG
jgi:hypothetical protein